MKIYDLSKCPIINRNGFYGRQVGRKDGSFIDKADEEKYIRDVQSYKTLMVSTDFRTIYATKEKPNNPDSVKQLKAKDFIEYVMQYP